MPCTYYAMQHEYACNIVFFQHHNTATPPYCDNTPCRIAVHALRVHANQDEMKYVFTMQNSSHGVNDDCISSYRASDDNSSSNSNNSSNNGNNSNDSEAWRCIFANESYAHTKTPMYCMCWVYSTTAS